MNLTSTSQRSRDYVIACVKVLSTPEPTHYLVFPFDCMKVTLFSGVEYMLCILELYKPGKSYPLAYTAFMLTRSPAIQRSFLLNLKCIKAWNNKSTPFQAHRILLVNITGSISKTTTQNNYIWIDAENIKAKQL